MSDAGGEALREAVAQLLDPAAFAAENASWFSVPARRARARELADAVLAAIVRAAGVSAEDDELRWCAVRKGVWHND